MYIRIVHTYSFQLSLALVDGREGGLVILHRDNDIEVSDVLPASRTMTTLCGKNDTELKLKYRRWHMC